VSRRAEGSQDDAHGRTGEAQGGFQSARGAALVEKVLAKDGDKQQKEAGNTKRCIHQKKRGGGGGLDLGATAGTAAKWGAMFSRVRRRTGHDGNLNGAETKDLLKGSRSTDEVHKKPPQSRKCPRGQDWDKRGGVGGGRLQVVLLKWYREEWSGKRPSRSGGEETAGEREGKGEKKRLILSWQCGRARDLTNEQRVSAVTIRASECWNVDRQRNRRYKRSGCRKRNGATPKASPQRK